MGQTHSGAPRPHPRQPAEGRSPELDRANTALQDLTGIAFRPIGTARADRGLKLLAIDARRIGTLTHPRRFAIRRLSLLTVAFARNAEVAIGLGGAVLLAKALNVEHGFWVVLGTLTVLRSNAIGTRRTAVQALLGTLLGFALASALIGVVAGDTTGLWIALPVLAFLSAYTPTAVNFVVGQASFTVLVVALFNLVVPEGWRTGLVRVQDIAAGAAISVVVGFVLWPRGAEGVVSDTFAELLSVDAHRLGDALDQIDGRATRAPGAPCPRVTTRNPPRRQTHKARSSPTR